MNKILLIDGNSMLFRAYYGTKYRGSMTSSSGVATNAVYGFSTMLTKALEMMTPTHILIAFDTSKKTFRHEMYEAYKGTRSELDPDLVTQFKLVREFLDAYPIQRIELEGYEADDIIGTIAAKHPNDEVIVLTSDRDMLQLIDTHTHIYLMKKGLTEIAVMDLDALKAELNIRPSQIIDLKAFMGDASDNIPGVPSIGEKTALKLLASYDTIDEVYANKDAIKGKMGEKIREFEEQARLSYELATIHTNVPIEFDIDDAVYALPNETLNAFFRKYDMNSLVVSDFDHVASERALIALVPFDESWKNKSISYICDIDAKKGFEGIAMFDGKKTTYLSMDKMRDRLFFDVIFSAKSLIGVHTKELQRFIFETFEMKEMKSEDVMLLSFLCDGLATTYEKFKDAHDLWFYDCEEDQRLLQAVNVLENVFKTLKETVESQGEWYVYETIERPLIPILARMEYTGIHVNVDVLESIKDATKQRLDALSDTIYGLAGVDFNINSPKQLGEVLFDTLQLPTKKKRSTAVDVLEGLLGVHPIIESILEYRKWQKLYSTYAVGLLKHVQADGKIHTRYQQHVASTGRLSSTEPNLQNISVRDEDTREIRKAFVASPDHLLCMIDYSQIELRILSYLANETTMLKAFNEGKDIHEETAKAFFNVDVVTSAQRRQAKTVNFGIIYGISEYGLSKQLGISVGEASVFIKRYHEIYPNISKYMNETIASCADKGYVTTSFGRRRYIPEIHDKNRAVAEFGKRAAMNAPIQGTAADVIKLAMIACDAYLKEHHPTSKMLLQVHDELIFDIPKQDVDEVSTALVEIMQSVVDWPIKLNVSCDIGATWYDA